MPTGGTPQHGAATAALAADATNDVETNFDPEDITGGQGLVEAVFSGMFEDEFDGVMPVRNHKVRLHLFCFHPAPLAALPMTLFLHMTCLTVSRDGIFA